MIDPHQVIAKLRKETDEARAALVKMTNDKNYWLDEYLRASQQNQQLEQRIFETEHRNEQSR